MKEKKRPVMKTTKKSGLLRGSIIFAAMALMTSSSDLVIAATPQPAGAYRNSSHGNSTTGVDRSTIDAKFTAYSKGNCAH